MPLAQAILDAIDRLKNKYNNGPYDPQTNPGGFDQDGHPINFFPALTDAANVVEAAAGQAEAAVLTAEDASNTALDRIATSQDRTAAATSAQQAQQAAAEVDLPSFDTGNPLDFIRLNASKTAYEFAAQSAPVIATKAQAEEGADNTTLMSPLRTSQAISKLSTAPLNMKAFTSSANWTVPEGVTRFKVTATGGGGGGNSSSAIEDGAGSGATAIKCYDVSPGDVVSITVGAAGAVNGNGGSTIVSVNGISITAGGGFGVPTSGFGGAGGVATGGDLNIPGSPGLASSSVTLGAASFWGGGLTKENGVGPYGAGGVAGRPGIQGVAVIEYAR